ncbi:hypothetical protein ACFQGA_08390 [Marinobacter koreensis]|uniref:Sulfotransferase family protein n=1 Tax=Marinobacter koreensis TaxID=335974 RepID=A0ABW0RKI5_9GAMM|nr:hypothetical protein [Marinobacter koreensis]MCK7546978.1 hypothetical protein [Marinobacter koreensis]
MELIIHIGMGKTGTTALQSFLDNEKERLMNSGVLPLGIRLQEILVNTPIISQGDVCDIKVLNEAFGALEHELGKKSQVFDKAIWSNEAFSMGYNSREIANYFLRYVERSKYFKSIKFVLVLRRQDEWVESAYKQWALKHKTNAETYIMTPDQYVERNKRLFEFQDIVDSWLYSEGVLDVFSYDDVLNDGGIVNYFCKYFGVDYCASFDKYSNVHESLGSTLSKLVSLYNRGRVGSVLPGEFVGVIRDAGLIELGEDGVFFVSYETRKAIFDRYAEANQSLAKILGRSDGFFSDRPVKKGKDFEFDPEIYFTYLSAICQNQQRRIENQNRRLHSLEEQMGELLTLLKARSGDE